MAIFEQNRGLSTLNEENKYLVNEVRILHEKIVITLLLMCNLNFVSLYSEEPVEVHPDSNPGPGITVQGGHGWGEDW
ncbi:hypothetical protein ABDI30_24495 [Paenibacillus cisolokensis]|uniref:hypothetical protein n=1 Tax=Paenibacillus cisolokensis TaxID=1658519 RepID=UPI003D29D89D